MNRNYFLITLMIFVISFAHAEAGSWFQSSERKTHGHEGSSSGATASNAFIQGANGIYTIYYDKNAWDIHNDRSSLDEKVNLTLDHKKGDAFAVATYEHIIMPLGSLKEMALSKFIDTTPPGKIVDEGVMTVNGEKVLMLKMIGFDKEDPVTYYGYYAAGQWGTLEFVTYTGTSLFGDYEKDFTQLLNGLVINNQPGNATSTI
ncbi:MAG: hypothetical protein EP297_00300 [Gammaproteobacteria bacterium]|nr:MAG: hypothetical protein EP297_00300 [Gammaproteobacteria bacterium]